MTVAVVVTMTVAVAVAVKIDRRQILLLAGAVVVVVMVAGVVYTSLRTIQYSAARNRDRRFQRLFCSIEYQKGLRNLLAFLLVRKSHFVRCTCALAE